MATYIKTGFWEKRANPKQGYKGELNLDNLIASVAPPSSIETLGTTLYSTNPAAGPNFSTSDSIFLGTGAGNNASSADNSVFLGYNAGDGAISAENSTFIGKQAGQNAINAYNSIFLGYFSGASATDASVCVFVGNQSGLNANQANECVFVGDEAGANSYTSTYSVFIGNRAGYNALPSLTSGANYANCIGYKAGYSNTGDDVNIIGREAGMGNTMSGMTIIANSTLPSYVDRAAAVAAITIPLGAAAGNTYLYYNQTAFAIEGVRL